MTPSPFIVGEWGTSTRAQLAILRYECERRERDERRQRLRAARAAAMRCRRKAGPDENEGSQVREEVYGYATGGRQ